MAVGLQAIRHSTLAKNETMIDRQYGMDNTPKDSE